MDAVTPGRIVVYVVNPDEAQSHPGLQASDSCVGLVVGVSADEVCNLVLWDQLGNMHTRLSVGHSEKGEPGTWHWPAIASPPPTGKRQL